MDSGAFLHGVDEMKRKLQAHAENLVRAQVTALRDEAEIEMTESKKRCPVDTGELKASGHVEPVVQTGSKMHVDLVYGGAAEAYAIYVHENLDANHDSPPFGGGQAKFLESVLMESLPSLGSRIAERIKENMR